MSRFFRPRPGFSNTDFVLPPTATVVGSLGFALSINYQAVYDPINTAGFWAARNMGAVLPPTKAARWRNYPASSTSG